MSPAPASAIDLRRGAIFMTASALLFALMGAAVKVASPVLPDAALVFARSVIGLLALLPWVVVRGRAAIATRHLSGHLVRSLAGFAAMFCFFHALAHLRLADAMLLNQSFPLFVPVVEVIWLRERIAPRVWALLALGFCGVLLVLRPGAAVFQPAALVGLASAIFAAVGQVGIRRLTRTEPVPRIVFYLCLISAIGSAVPLASAWVTPPRSVWGAVLLVGILATIGQLFLTRAYASAPAAWVGPFVFTGVVFSGLFDWAVWRRPPDVLFGCGALLVLVSVALTLRLTTRGVEPLAEP